MQKFKEHWQITKNWQLLFPLFGILSVVYSSYKAVKMFLGDYSLILVASVSLFIAYILTRFCLIIFKKLEKKWVVEQRWEIIRIFIIFAITGSSSVLIGRPVIRLLGITKENLNSFVYYILFVFISLIFYQIFLVFFGWILGQFKFFWEFEKKMLSRFGLGSLFKNNS